MLYLDTSCFLKLYYPEADSQTVIDTVSDQTVLYTSFHELELTTALELKVFRKEATKPQVRTVWQGIQADVERGRLFSLQCDWPSIWRLAIELGSRHSATSGCRSLDVLHCALASSLKSPLLTTDRRQAALAQSVGLVVLHP